MQLKHLGAIYHLAQKLENVDGTPNEARLQHLRDFLNEYELPENGVSIIKNMAEEMNDDRALWLIRDLDKEDKLRLTYLFAAIACTDDKLTEIGRDLVTFYVQECNLPIPGAEDTWKEVCHENLPSAERPIPPAFIHIRPDGLTTVRESEHEDWQSLNKDIAEWIGAPRTEVVRYTAPLNEISARLRLKGRHLVFLVDSNGQAHDADDNMTGTMLYGRGSEILGNIVLALETDEGYKLEGIRNNDLLNYIFTAVNDKVDYLLQTN